MPTTPVTTRPGRSAEEGQDDEIQLEGFWPYQGDVRRGPPRASRPSRRGEHGARRPVQRRAEAPGVRLRFAVERAQRNDRWPVARSEHEPTSSYLRADHLRARGL